MRPALAALLVSLLTAGGACVTGRPALPPLQPDAYPGVLLDPANIPGNFMWRQSIRAHYREPDGSKGSVRFEAIVQKRGPVLSVLGMTPFGTRAFLIEQRGQSIQTRKFIDAESPLPSRFMLIDIHRTFFGGITAEAHAGADHRAGGWIAVEQDGEEVRERHAYGKLLERRFRRLDGRPEGEIRIRYGDGFHDLQPPRHVELDNRWFGYRLEIETLERTTLPGS